MGLKIRLKSEYFLLVCGFWIAAVNGPSTSTDSMCTTPLPPILFLGSYTYQRRQPTTQTLPRTLSFTAFSIRTILYIRIMKLTKSN